MSIHKDKQAYNLSKRFYGQFHPRTLFYRFFCSSNCIGYIIWIFLRPISFIKLKICYPRRYFNKLLVSYRFSKFAKKNKSEKISKFIKTIALYLPQYHEIPENNKWWGNGFTEWTNVKKSQPLFDGHYQPHVPHKDIGYYDLSDINVMKKQVNIAKEYGIYGFCFYYYHFANGKRLLEKPINNYIKAKDIDFPFCFAWANENWTRNWDGGNQEVIMPQDYSEKNMLKMLDDMMPAFKDKRYIKIEGKPVLLVYRAEIIPEVRKIVNNWRKIAKSNGFEDIYLISMQNFKEINPYNMGFDAAVEFAPQLSSHYPEKIKVKETFKDLLNTNATLADIKEVIDNMTYRNRVNYPRVKCICPSWDNSPRRKNKGARILLNASPSKFKTFLKIAIRESISNNLPANGMLFINAWNEWGEGAHLEPDERFGYQYLRNIKQILSKTIETLD